MSERPLSRRSLLALAAGAAGAALVPDAPDAAAQSPASPASPQAAPQTEPRPAVPDDPTRQQGAVPSEVGQRSPFEKPRRRVNRALPSGESETPLQDLRGIVTPADLHFERHHGGIPAIDPARYALLIHGMVERPMVFTLDDLKRFPSRSRLYMLECSGNGRRAYGAGQRKDRTPQYIDGLTSTSEWTGVPLATLFREVGVRPGATWFLAEGQDAAKMTRSVPVEKAMDDALIVYGQNGEALRPEQGYPARLFLPGWEGNASVKWLRRIELSDRPFMTREETSKYTDPLANGTARIFSFTMDAKSTLTYPVFPHVLAGRGFHEIRGLAWSGRGRITRVDVSTDGGATWAEATLEDPVLPKCHTRFTYGWRWDGRPAVLMSRATDETGYVQPTLAELTAARGAGTNYHMNNIRGWQVEADGKVFFHVPEA